MLTIIVGGQYGGEGKGKIGAYLGLHQNFDVVCRCGGVNSSHTVVHHGRTTRLRLLPAACATSRPRRVVFGAGMLLHIPTLMKEIAITKTDPHSVIIDPRAGIVDNHHVLQQQKDKRYKKLGSTLTGTGYATAERCMRKLKLAKDYPKLSGMLGDVPILLARQLKGGTQVLIEGHQGLGLSNYHGDYPYTSSRDTIVAAYLSELGLSPGWKMRIILAIKTFPTRNHPGNLYKEMTPEQAVRLGVVEFGGGSWGKNDVQRRVGRFDLKMVERAAMVNGATEIAITGMDHLFPAMRDKHTRSGVCADAKPFVQRIQSKLKIPVTLLSTGPETDAMIKLGSGRN